MLKKFKPLIIVRLSNSNFIRLIDKRIKGDVYCKFGNGDVNYGIGNGDVDYGIGYPVEERKELLFTMMSGP